MSKQVWVVCQQRQGKLHRMSREAIAAGQQLAREIAGTASAVVLGSGIGALAQEVAGFDLETVYAADCEVLGDYSPGAYVGALAPAISTRQPAFVVFPHTYQSVDYFPRLGQAVDAAVLPEVVSFSTVDDGGLVWQRPILGGKLQATVRVQGEGTVLVSVQSGAFAADQAAAGEAQVLDLPTDLSQVASDREILGPETVGSSDVDLTKADVIVGVGRGVGGADKLGPVEELAQALGADIGASRPVIDSGWLPRERQIGSSGQTVAPKLYLAVGISGAIQHLVGMKGSSCVVAINKDPSAPIFGVSNYGIVGDLHDIVPVLTEAIQEAKG